MYDKSSGEARCILLIGEKSGWVVAAQVRKQANISVKENGQYT